MANFSKARFGEGATKGVDLVVSVYDNGHWSKEVPGKDGAKPTKREGVFVQQTVHPDSPIAAGQTYLGLKAVPGDNGRVNTNENLATSQFAKVVEAAGDNTSPLLNAEGEQVGTNYGVKADIMFGGAKKGSDGKAGARYALLNSKTLAPSDLSVAPQGDQTINDRIFASQAEAKAARTAAAEAEAPQADAPAVEVETETEAPQAEEPELG